MSTSDDMKVYYDGSCPICTAAANGWQDRADEKGIVLQLLQDATLEAGEPTRQELESAIHVRSAGGWLRGARALRAIYERLGNRPMTLLLSVGIALRIADPIYALIARHRMHLPFLGRR